MSSKIENCNCLTGTPYITADGQCGCTDSPAGAPPFQSNPWMKVRALRSAAAGPAPAASSDNTILGMPPLVALGVAAAALYFFSNSKANGGTK